MDQFLDIAIWVFMTFMIVNAGVYWFAQQDTMIDNGLAVAGITERTDFTEADQNIFFFGTDCSTASPTDLAYGPCFLARTFNAVTTGVDNLWTFLTSWTHLLDAILPDWIPASGLFKDILIPLFGIIQFFAILVILMRVAGIVRGGS